MTIFEYGDSIQHTGQMTDQHIDHYKATGELQLPLFDTANQEDTWKTSDSWAVRIAKVDAMREAFIGQSK